MVQRELDGGSTPGQSTDIEVEQPGGSSGDVRGIDVSPYHHYTGLCRVMMA